MPRTHKDVIDPSDLAPQFDRYYEPSNLVTLATRIEVTRTYADGTTRVRHGRVGMTTGWRPSYLLMARSNSYGSSDLLSHDDVITGVKYHGSRTYNPPMYFAGPSVKPVSLVHPKRVA